MMLNDTSTDAPKVALDAFDKLLRVRHAKCQKCGTEEKALLNQLEKKGWMVTNTFTLCPADR
jgi:hypothetical protein